MPRCTNYCISKLSVRTFECVYTSKTTALIIGSKHPHIAAARTKSYGQRAFSYQGPMNWNRVPGGIRTVEEKDTFTRYLKTAIFSAECISTLSHYHYILLFIISSCVHCCSVLFQCDCLAFWVLFNNLLL